MEIVSVDPGKDHFAYAVFTGKKDLVTCGIKRWVNHYDLTHEAQTLAQLASVVIMEKMQIYPHERVKDPNDLIDVTFTAGIIAGHFHQVKQITAQQWKGQVSKSVTQSRVIKILGYDPGLGMLKKDSNHVYDAIGIGLNYLGFYK